MPSVMDERRRASSRLQPCTVPALERLELVPPRGPSGALRAPHHVRHVRARQVRLEVSVVRMRHVVGVFLVPVAPGATRRRAARSTRAASSDHVRRRRQRGLQPADVAIDQLVVQDVAVHLGERGVAVGEASQQDHELQQVGVRLLPERLLALAEQVVQQRGDGIGHRVGVEIVVQRVVADVGVEPDLDVVRLPPAGPQHGLHLPAEVALDLHDEAAHLVVRVVRCASARVDPRTGTCRRTSCRCRPRPATMTPV